MIHSLKTWTQQFEAVLSGDKTFEIRKNDRNFKVGDLLQLIEYFPEKNGFGIREIWKKVTYIMPLSRQMCDGCGEASNSYIIMGINNVPSNEVIKIKFSGGEIEDCVFLDAKAYLDNGSAEVVWD